MERCPDFNPLKYSRDVYSSHWDKEADCLHSILFEEWNTLTCIVGVRTAALQVGKQQLSAEWLALKKINEKESSESNRIRFVFLYNTSPIV